MYMTKQDLLQIKDIIREIECLKKQIADAEYKAEQKMVYDTVRGSRSEYPYTECNIRIKGVDITGSERQVNRLRNVYRSRISELLKKVEAVNDYIAAVQDAEMRAILSLRYVNGSSWQRIAEELGSIGDGSTERKKHDRFMKVSRFS